MKNPLLNDLGMMDIYLIDQLMKSRIPAYAKILDAGYGKGRNMEYFVRNNFDIYGIDHNASYGPIVKEKCKEWNSDFDETRITTGKLEELSYKSESFDFVFSIAVLHFANSNDHFMAMLNEMLRVTKKGGFIMFRMTSWHTFDLFAKNETNIITIADGDRYMLDIDFLKNKVEKEGYKFVDPVKTTNVDGHRTMTTIVIQK